MNKSTKQGILFFGTAVLIVILDQLTKWMITQKIMLHGQIVLIPGFLNLYHIINTGAGLGLFKSYTAILAWISLMVVGIILYYYPRIVKDKLAFWLCSFILGGTFGNLIDRTRIGGVIDFIDFRHGFFYFPTFNVADAFISIPAIILVIYLWRQEKKESKRTDSQPNQPRSRLGSARKPALNKKT